MVGSVLFFVVDSVVTVVVVVVLTVCVVCGLRAAVVPIAVLREVVRTEVLPAVVCVTAGARVVDFLRAVPVVVTVVILK